MNADLRHDHHVIDCIVVGAGHNGLVTAAYLARSGYSVLVLEANSSVGGAAVSAEVFPGMGARVSKYSYLVSLLPPAIARDLAIDVPLARRRVASYTPDPADPRRALVIPSDDEQSLAANIEDISAEPDCSFLIDGMAVLRDINRALRWNLPTNGPKTLNGFVLEHLETIPEFNLCIQIDEYQIETLQIKDNIIKSLRIRRLAGDDPLVD